MPVNTHMKERCQLFRTLWNHDPEFRDFALANAIEPRLVMLLESQALQTHHIFGGTSRLNRKSNLIRLCEVVHRYAHRRQYCVRIACIWKQLKNGVLDWEQLDECRDKRKPGCARRLVEAAEVDGIYRAMQTELLNDRTRTSLPAVSE